MILISILFFPALEVLAEHCRELEYLDISGCTQISDEGLQHFITTWERDGPPQHVMKVVIGGEYVKIRIKAFTWY